MSITNQLIADISNFPPLLRFMKEFVFLPFHLLGGTVGLVLAKRLEIKMICVPSGERS